jgi:hypothetical protein
MPQETQPRLPLAESARPTLIGRKPNNHQVSKTEQQLQPMQLSHVAARQHRSARTRIWQRNRLASCNLGLLSLSGSQCSWHFRFTVKIVQTSANGGSGLWQVVRPDLHRCCLSYLLRLNKWPGQHPASCLSTTLFTNNRYSNHFALLLHISPAPQQVARAASCKQLL